MKYPATKKALIDAMNKAMATVNAMLLKST
jgi:hypothetical protein